MILAGVCWALTAFSGAAQNDVVILGELHDNPEHHRMQASYAREKSPTAIVFEMLTPEQAAWIGPDTARDAETLGPLLDWDRTGWPDIAFYAPIMAAAPEAAIVGTGMNDWVEAEQGLRLATMPERTGPYGYPDPLDDAELARRIAGQIAAHCDAIDAALARTMVDMQRQRDVVLADAVLRAHEDYGAPVMLITGNGHARADWGVPALLARAAPHLEVLTIGQGEGGDAPEGEFDLVHDAPVVDRSDPCDAFAAGHAMDGGREAD